MFEGKEALLLDMNSTFMFNEDRFGEDENFSAYYQSIGGGLSSDYVNALIFDVFDYLGERYPSEHYRHSFPSVAVAVDECTDGKLPESEKEKLVRTFSYHEHGVIPDQYVSALKRLKERFILSTVIDIWAPKERWVSTFKKLDIWGLFSVNSFSSDHGMVKPSPKPYEMVVEQLNLSKAQCLVVGDSVKRDLGGAQAAGIDCILVGGAESSLAVGQYASLLAFMEAAMP